MLPIGPCNFAYNIGVESVNKLCGCFAFRGSFVDLLVWRHDNGEIGKLVFWIACCPPGVPWKIMFEPRGKLVHGLFHRSLRLWFNTIVGCLMDFHIVFLWFSFRAAGKFRRIFVARDGDDLQRFGHRRINMEHVNVIADLRTETHSHRSFVNNFAGAVTDH
jgi:hypothetical protein